MKTQVEVDIPESVLVESANTEIIELRKQVKSLTDKLERKTKEYENLKTKLKDFKEDKKKLKELAHDFLEACDASDLLEIDNS